MKIKEINKQLKKITQEANEKSSNINSQQQLLEFKAALLGRKGTLTQIFESIKTLDEGDRKKVGQATNQTKIEIQKIIRKQQRILAQAAAKIIAAEPKVNLNLPAIAWKTKKPGHLHPITRTIYEILEAMKQVGFEIIEGPEIENDYYNFEALNMPKHHPARDKWDTFYLGNNHQSVSMLLRTHTSPAQVRIMERKKPPIKVAVPGKCFRRENEDSTHLSEFFQIEALVVDKNLSLSDLKGILVSIFQQLFGKQHQIRFRPTYFPFTEPSIELDLVCNKCQGNGCENCFGKGIMEILGAGMVHPKVLQKANIDPKIYNGYAFGLGPDRIAMMKYGISDMRDLYRGNLRFLKQF